VGAIIIQLQCVLLELNNSFAYWANKLPKVLFQICAADGI